MNCGGNCESCTGCAKTLSLTDIELHILDMLAQFAFLPVARTAQDMVPVYLEQSAYTREHCSLALQCLEKKGLVVLDYAAPLAGACMQAYQGLPVHGSISLTQRGQAVVELLQIQGIDAQENGLD